MLTKRKGINPRRMPQTSLRRNLNWPADSEEMKMRDALARELLSVCMMALESYGLDRARLSELANDAVHGGDSTPATKRTLEDIYWMGELISDWAEHPDYLDNDGRPQVIRINGAGVSLASLSRKFFGSRPVAEIIRLGCQTQVMELIGDDRVARMNSCVMFTGNPLLVLAHSTRSIRRFLRSANYNAWTSIDAAHSWPEQTAFNAVPEEDFNEFVQVMRKQMASILELGNRWLTSRASEKRRAESTKYVTMGVQAFVFRE